MTSVQAPIVPPEASAWTPSGAQATGSPTVVGVAGLPATLTCATSRPRCRLRTCSELAGAVHSAAAEGWHRPRDVVWSVPGLMGSRLRMSTHRTRLCVVPSPRSRAASPFRAASRARPTKRPAARSTSPRATDRARSSSTTPRPDGARSTAGRRRRARGLRPARGLPPVRQTRRRRARQERLARGHALARRGRPTPAARRARPRRGLWWFLRRPVVRARRLGQHVRADVPAHGRGVCSTSPPAGVAIAGYVGYTWDPIGLELFGAFGSTTRRPRRRSTASCSRARTPHSRAPRAPSSSRSCAAVARRHPRTRDDRRTEGARLVRARAGLRRARHGDGPHHDDDGDAGRGDLFVPQPISYVTRSARRSRRRSRTDWHERVAHGGLSMWLENAGTTPRRRRPTTLPVSTRGAASNTELPARVGHAVLPVARSSGMQFGPLIRGAWSSRSPPSPRSSSSAPPPAGSEPSSASAAASSSFRRSSSPSASRRRSPSRRP